MDLQFVDDMERRVREAFNPYGMVVKSVDAGAIEQIDNRSTRIAVLGIIGAEPWGAYATRSDSQG